MVNNFHYFVSIVKQGQLSTPNMKYQSTFQTFLLILREEGFKGFYGGYSAAALGSLLSSTVHFGVYENMKQRLLDNGVNESVGFLMSAACGDVVSSVFYVPSEVLKTRLQLQGSHNNPYSISSHNYKGNLHALTSV